MSIEFKMIGRLSPKKDTEKFKAYEEKEVGSKGWITRRYNFNIFSNTNIFEMSIKDGKWKDESNKIYLWTKGTFGDNGVKTKGEQLIIPFKERLTHPRLSEVAEFKKYIFDVEEPGRRYKIKRALQVVKGEADLSSKENEDKTLLDLCSLSKEELEKELATSEKKRKEFVTAWDFAEFIKKVIDSEKYKDVKFFIDGEYEITYNESNNTYYRNYIPRKIYLADQSADEYANATVDFYFNQDSLDSSMLAETGKYFVNGKVRVYDNNRKADIPADYQIAFNAAKDDSEMEKKREEVLVGRFTSYDETWYNYGVIVELLNGSQREEIKFEDLTSEQQDSIIIGELTLEDIQRELGGFTYGDRVIENRFLKPARGFSNGREETKYSDEDFDISYREDSEDSGDSLFDEETVQVSSSEADDEDDLFEDII